MKLKRNNERRRELVLVYRKELSSLPGWTVPFADYGGDSAYHLMVAVAPTEEARLQTVENLTKRGIQTSRHYPCVPDLSAFRRYRTENLDRSVSFASRAITLPLFPTMTPRNAEEIYACIAESAR